MKTLYELVPRTRTSTDIDFRTGLLHSKRNGLLSGTVFAEDDFAPPILSHTIVNEYHQKKIFLWYKRQYKYSIYYRVFDILLV